MRDFSTRRNILRCARPHFGGGRVAPSVCAVGAVLAMSLFAGRLEAQLLPGSLRDATKRFRSETTKLDSIEAPRLRLPALYGPLADLFSDPPSYGPIGEGQPLLRRLFGSGLLEKSTPFASKNVSVDSAGMHYTRNTAGFAVGAPLTVPFQWYLDRGYEHTSRQRWMQIAGGEFKSSVVGQRGRTGRSGGRLSWHVPIPAPAPIRRFIGEEGSLKINGSHTATISGKSSWTAGEVQTLAGRPSKFPALGMTQESKFRVEGKVGEAVHIVIDQDTQQLGTGVSASSFRDQFRDQLANQIKLDYKGNEDDIFREIQAGNTTLALPSTRFVGFSQQHKGLFGIRAKGRVGPLGFTMIASHEKSESNRQTFRGGAVVDTTKIQDFRYLRSTYFWLDRRYRERLGDFREVNQGFPSDFVADDVIDESSLVVYINDFNVNNDAQDLAKPGVALVDPNAPADERTGHFEEGTWHQLDPDDDYTLLREFGYILLRRAVPDRHALAVRYRTRGGEVFGSGGDQLQLKLIKARDMRPEFPTWDLEWKNVYKIVSGFARGRKFERDRIRVEVLLEVPGTDPVSTQNGDNFLGLMGLDERGQDPGTRPDQIIDADYIGLDDSRGHLIFPDLTPFAPQHAKYNKLDERVPAIYASHQQRDKDEASRYIVQVINSSAQQRINLSRGRLAGIDPQSVEVRLNGRRLDRGRDFNVSMLGEVTFTGTAEQDVADPGADLEITFESQDLIGLGSQQKTLLGTRAQYEFWDGDGNIGTTILYNNVRSVDRRVRVGAEPVRTVVWDTDIRARFEAPVLTRVVDALPRVKTVARSDVTIQAEVAQSRPNLNTRGQGYIDDFEGSERPEILSVLRQRWTLSSRPKDPLFDDADRSRMIWYNPFDKIQRTEIWPGQEDLFESRNNNTDILVLELTPLEDGAELWNAVMTSWTGGVRDFSQAKFLEIWVRGDVGQLHVDLGAIDEDLIANGILDTEDEPFAGLTSGDNQVSAEEDVGIDGRDDEEELNYYLARAGEDTTGSREDRVALFRANIELDGRDPGDPEGDNWDFDRGRKHDNSRINGTQGNRLKDNAIRPDTEDINQDGILNTSNDYFHYTIDLAADAHVPGTQSNGWRLYRRPLYDERVGRVGSPNSSRIEYGRLVFVSDAGGGEEPAKVEIAQIEIIGNDWQEDDLVVLEDSMPLGEDESFNVTVIGTDENQTYKPPESVKRRRIRNSRAREREQSLVLEYENLDSGHQVSATKVLSRTADYTKYTRLKMFVHGDSSDTYVVEIDSSDLEMFVRFGRDSTNYYEFATRIFKGWDTRNEVDIDLLTMSALKAELERGRFDSLGQRVTVLDSVVVHPDFRGGTPARYRVRGSPSMQQIRQLTLGVRNRGDMGVYSGRVYADELRLDEARNDAGLALYGSIKAGLADLASVNGSVEWRGENYRTISNPGRNKTSMKTSLATTSNMDKFLPGSWGFTIPVKATFNQQASLPRFRPSSDVELTSAQKQELKTQSTKQLYEISISKRGGKTWLLRWTIDQMNLRLSKTRERGFSPTNPVKDRDAETISFAYKMPVPVATVPFMRWLPEFAPKGIRKADLRYLPTTLNYSLNVNRLDTANQRVGADTTFKETFDMKETYTAKVNPVKSLSGNYSLQVNRDLRKKYAPKSLSFGSEVQRNQKADTKLTLRLVKWLDQNYTFQANYEEIGDPRRRRAQALVDTLTGQPIRTRDITSKNTLSARVNIKLPQLLKSVGGRGSGKKGKDDSGKSVALWKRTFQLAGGRLEPISTSWRRNLDARNFSVTERASLLYQLGIEESLNVTRASVGLTQQDQWSKSTNSEVSSGLRLPLGVSVKPSLKRERTRRSGSTQTRLRVKEQLFFPRISVNWGRAGNLPYLKRVMNNATMNAQYNVTQTKEGEGSLDSRHLIQKSDSREVSVTWSGQWRIGPVTTIKFKRSSGDDVDFELASSIDSSFVEGATPPVRGTGKSVKRSTSLETKYNLRPRSLPLFGKLKSSVDLVFKVNRSSDRRSSGSGVQEQAPISAKDATKLELKATYKFSDTFRGNGVIRYENNTNGLTDRTRKIREVRMAGTFIFR